MAQYPLPQFIEEENKITFFLTFRQFFLLIGGGAFCLALYYTLPFSFFIVSSIFIMLVISAVAFLKIDDEKITKIIYHFLNFYTDDKNYTWGKKDASYPFKNNKDLSQEDKVKDEGNKDGQEYTYLKSNQTNTISANIATTQSSKINAAKKVIEFKAK